ncbi:COP1-interacting protein 7-like [Papaver somniferum]|nr:COP1-interacting protein 7-like [Papaver somniferum]
MKSGTRLDSLVFQLTPTRTRCELVIIANGKTEKVSSGLLNPFLAHLKTAQDQINKGGYSITLEPNAGSDASWFTKGTVERFIRFVSTPEVLERVNTIESEILQIEKAIVVQSNENMGLITVEEPQRNAEASQKKVEEHQAKQPLAIEGSKPALDSDAEKAIVLYQPEAQTPLSDRTTTHEEHSRIQLLRVLETRRTVLRKEQGMAFARAVAAGFDMDDMPYLVSFAECFGALRLMDACLRFIELWKVKHETGQWLEIEASEAMSTRSDFSPMGKSELGIETNGHVNNDARADLSSDNVRDNRASVDTQVPPGQHDYIPCQFQHPMYPQWPIHSPPGAPPGYQPYPMQGIPYYNYPGSVPYFHPPYPPMEDPRFHTPQKMGLKRHSIDSKDGSIELDNWDGGSSNKRSQDGSEVENEGSHREHSRRKSSRSGNKKSGTVVIQNINYITSKKQDTFASETESVSSSETDEEADDFVMKDKNSLRASKSEERGTKSTDAWDSSDNGAAGYGQNTDGGHWLAFQTALLRDDDKKSFANDQAMFSSEKEAQVTRQTNGTWPDPLVPHYGQDMSQGQEHRTAEFDAINGKLARMLKTSDDGSMFSQGEFNRESRDVQVSVNYSEIEGVRGSYKRGASDDFVIHRQVHSNYVESLSDPLNGNGLEHSANNLDGNSSYNVSDESFIIPLRSSSQDHFGTQGRTTIYMDSELPSGPQSAEDLGNMGRNLPSYEPDDLSMLPERGGERESTGYDPALDYEMQVVEAQSISKEDFVTVDEDPKHKDKKLKGVQSSLEKRRAEAALRKANPSKLTPPNDAQARAAKLRAYKADLQKMKKEKDEEDKKRLEALKRERQRRIAARGGATAAESTLPSQLKPRQLPKLSPTSHKGYKFCDSEPSPVSPLQRLPTRTTSVGSRDSLKITKPNKLNNSDRIAGNGLSRSVSSIPELKKINNDLTAEAKVATRPIRRLSEPRMNKSLDDSSGKSQRSNPSSKTRVSNGSESNKITALMSLDKTKAATLPELKIKTPRVSSNIPQNRPMANEAMQKANGSTHAITSGSRKVKGSIGKILHESDVDDNPVIEKAVVMLERDTPPTLVVQEIEERMKIRNGSDKIGDKTEVVLEYAAIHAAASPLTADDTICDASDLHVDELPSYQVHTAPADYGGEVLSKFSTLSVAEKPYQAPYARVSSLEDPCTTNVQYTKAPPRSSEATADGNETVKAHISDYTAPTSVEQIVESSDNHHGKESSKGFKRFLKLGRKNRSSSSDQRNVESDRLSTDSTLADDRVVSAAEPDEAHTLKNLISQNETPTGSTPQKASRHFSLLSPFRSKSSEKKQSRT